MIKLVRSRCDTEITVQYKVKKMDQHSPITIREDETAFSAVKRLLQFLEIPFEEDVDPESLISR